MSAALFLDDGRYARVIEHLVERQKHWEDIVLAVQVVREKLEETPRDPDKRFQDVWIHVGTKGHVLMWFWDNNYPISNDSVKVVLVNE